MTDNEARVNRDWFKSSQEKHMPPKGERPPGCYKRITFVALVTTATFAVGYAGIVYGREALLWLGAY